jgi:hypothetical protein
MRQEDRRRIDMGRLVGSTVDSREKMMRNETLKPSGADAAKAADEEAVPAKNPDPESVAKPAPQQGSLDAVARAQEGQYSAEAVWKAAGRFARLR